MTSPPPQALVDELDASLRADVRSKRGRKIRPFAFQQAADADVLQGREVLTIRRVRPVAARVDDFLRSTGQLIIERDQHPELRVTAVVDGPGKVAYVGGWHGFSTLNANQNLANRLLIDNEAAHAVNPFISDLLLVRLGVQHGNCPTLEIKGRFLKQSPRRLHIMWDSVYLYVPHDGLSVCRLQSLNDQIYTYVRDVYPNPLTAELLCRINGGAAAAERVKHDISGVGRRFNYAVQEGEWLLCRVAKSFLRCRVKGVNLPDVMT